MDELKPRLLSSSPPCIPVLNPGPDRIAVAIEYVTGEPIRWRPRNQGQKPLKEVESQKCADTKGISKEK